MFSHALHHKIHVVAVAEITLIQIHLKTWKFNLFWNFVENTREEGKHAKSIDHTDQVLIFNISSILTSISIQYSKKMSLTAWKRHVIIYGNQLSKVIILYIILLDMYDLDDIIE